MSFFLFFYWDIYLNYVVTIRHVLINTCMHTGIHITLQKLFITHFLLDINHLLSLVCFDVWWSIVNFQNHPKSLCLDFFLHLLGGVILCFFRISYYPLAMFQFHATLMLWLFSSPFSFCHYLLSFIYSCSIFSFSSYTIPKLHGHFQYCVKFCYLFHLLLCSSYDFYCHFTYYNYTLEILWNCT